MAVSLVTCSRCGRVFDPIAEHCLLDQRTNTYTCGRCLGNTAAPGSRSVFTAPSAPPAAKPRSRVGTYLRVIFGILFILSAFSSTDDGSTFLTCFVIGAALLIWQFWPQLRQLILGKKARAAAEKQAEAARQQAEEERKRELSRKWICSHCGATTSGMACEYCGMPREG